MFANRFFMLQCDCIRTMKRYTWSMALWHRDTRRETGENGDDVGAAGVWRWWNDVYGSINDAMTWMVRLEYFEWLLISHQLLIFQMFHLFLERLATRLEIVFDENMENISWPCVFSFSLSHFFFLFYSFFASLVSLFSSTFYPSHTKLRTYIVIQKVVTAI